MLPRRATPWLGRHSLVNGLLNAMGDLPNFSVAINRDQVRSRLVEIDQGSGLIPVHLEAIANDRFRVILATPIEQACNEHVVNHIKVDGAVRALANILENFIQGFGLWLIPGKSIQDPSLLVGLDPLEGFLDQTQHDAIGHEITLGHIAVSFLAQGGAVAHGGAQNFPRGDVGEVEFLGDDRRLSSFTCTGGAEKNQTCHYCFTIPS